MSATSVTGTGPGDSKKRVAYLSSDLPKLVGTTTTSNPQDLITNPNCGCEDNPWELAYARFIPSTDPNDASPIATGVVQDSDFDWLLGITLSATSVPITAPFIIAVANATIVSPTITATFGLLFSPDGGTTTVPIAGIPVVFFGASLGLIQLEHGAFGLDAVGTITVLTVGSSNFTLNNPGKFITSDYQDTGTSCYMVIAKRRILS